MTPQCSPVLEAFFPRIEVKTPYLISKCSWKLCIMTMIMICMFTMLNEFPAKFQKMTAKKFITRTLFEIQPTTCHSYRRVETFLH